MEHIIFTTGLCKNFRSLTGRKNVLALDGLNLAVERGEIFGLLGPNGAGKTTTVKLLLGLTHPTAGSAELMGIPVNNPESRRQVGYLPEGHRFPGYLTARQTLSIFGRMSGVRSATLKARIPELLEKLRLTEWIDVRVKKFSKGMIQRLGLAAALIHDPQVLLLDEPTDGVDPVGRREIRDLLLDEAHKGKTILMNSHLLSEIELTCSRVAVLRKGKTVAIGRIEDLTRTESQYKMVASQIDDRLLDVFRESGAGVNCQNGHILLSTRDVAHLNTLIDLLRAHGGLLSELTPVRSSLEDVFVDLIQTGEAGKKIGVKQ